MLSHFSPVWLCSSTDFSLLGSSIHGILQARILKWAAMPSSRGSSWSMDWTRAFLISLALAGRFFTTSATWEGQSLSYSASILNWTPCEKHSIKVTLPNQTWIWSPACGKANLLTPNCGEKKSATFIAECQARSPGQLVLKTLPDGFFWKDFFTKARLGRGSPRVWGQFMHNSLTGWWWGNRGYHYQSLSDSRSGSYVLVVINSLISSIWWWFWHL